MTKEALRLTSVTHIDGANDARSRIVRDFSSGDNVSSLAIQSYALIAHKTDGL